MSDEYISKAKAIEEVNCALDRETLLFSFVRKVTISALKRLPSADVAPVVRCRDCKHWQRGMVGMGCYWDADYPHEENDFCSCGERREE